MAFPGRVLSRGSLCFVMLLAVLATPAYAGDLEDARAAFDVGKWEAAAVAYRKVIDADPTSYVAHVWYQAALRRSGADASQLTTYYDGLVSQSAATVAFQLHRARLAAPTARLKLLKTIGASHATDLNVALEVGRAHLESGDPTKALAPLKKAAGLGTSGRTDAAVLYALAMARKGRARDAEKLLATTLQASADAVGAWLALARVQLGQGSWADAQKSAESVLLMRPRSVAALLLRAQAASAAGDTPAALESAGAAHRLAPHLAATATALADYVVLEVTEATLTRAQGLYEQALASDDAFTGALNGLGWVLEQQGKWADAEKQYRALRTLRPDDAQPVNSVGWCLFKRGRVSESQVHFRKAIDLDSDFGAAMANLGMTYDAQKKYSKAIKVYEKVLRMPAHKEDLRVLINCAFDHESLGAFSKAIKLFKKALTIKPGDAGIMTWLGDSWFFQNKWKQAERRYGEATQADKTLFPAWRGLGYTLARRSKWEESAAALERAKSLDKEDTDVPLMLGDIYLHELEDLPKALDAYRTYVDRGGDDPDVPELITEIENQLK